mgnify:CR=1 FL=1
MPAARDILRRLLLVLLAAALGLDAYLMNAGGIARNALPMPFGVGLATVESNSMAPAFQRGDLLVVAALDGAPAIGDVVVYQDPTIGLVSHRVVAVDGDLVTTQGDANNTADAPFDRALIVGHVLAVVPAVGLLVAALKTPIGVLALLLAAFLLVELPFRRHREDEEDERQRLRAQIAQLKERQANHQDGGEHDED